MASPLMDEDAEAVAAALKAAHASCKAYDDDEEADEQFPAFLRGEIDRWGKVIRDRKLNVDAQREARVATNASGTLSIRQPASALAG